MELAEVIERETGWRRDVARACIDAGLVFDAHTTDDPVVESVWDGEVPRFYVYDATR